MIVVRATELPLRFVSSSVTVAGADEVFAIATPDCTEPPSDVSTYMRNAVASATAGTPASATRTPFLSYEKTREPAGAGMPAAGVKLTDPSATAPAAK